MKKKVSKAAKPHPKKFRLKWYHIVGLILIAYIIYALAMIVYFRTLHTITDSMAPTFVKGQYYFTHRFFGDPKRGDIIILDRPAETPRSFVRRVVAVPGDTVLIQNGNLYVNTQLVDESTYLKHDVKTYGGPFIPDGKLVTVPHRSYFVLGDNRTASRDSREWGFVSRSAIISKQAFCYWKCSSAQQ